MATPKYVFINGEIVPWEQGTVHISTGAFKFGAAVFEGVRGYWNEEQEQMYVFRLAEHMDRLVHSQVFMRFDQIMDTAQIGEQTLDLIRANEHRENIHIVNTVFVNGPGGPVARGPVGVSITTGQWAGRPHTTNGCSAQVSSWQRIPDTSMPPRIKCNANYQNGRLAGIQALEDGYDTALMLNTRGKVSEGPGMCFFMIRRGKVVTPSVTNDILESVTRDTMLEIIPEYLDMEVVERDIDRSELLSADEAFYCGTAWEVTPVTSVDRVPLGDGDVGPLVRKLQQTYFDIVSGRINAHPEWRTAVY